MKGPNIVDKLYAQYMHASQWMHHHTFTVVLAIVVFATVWARQFAGYFVDAKIVQAAGPQVDMSISNTVLPAQAAPWSTVTFFYYYQNESLSFNGNVPSTINISADIPAWLTFVDSTPAPTTNTNSTLLRNNMPLTDDAYGFIIVQMQVDQNPPNPIMQTVNLMMPNNTDPIGYNDSQSSEIITTWGWNGWWNSLIDVDLSISKSWPATANVWGTINYTINYENVGSEIATNISIIDVIPAGTQFIDNGLIGINTIPQASTITGDYNEVYIRNIPSLAPWQQWSISVSATVTPWLPDGFGLFNIVQINSDQNDTWSNNFSYVSTTVQATWADLAITKSATVNTAYIGQSFQYNMLISNNGPDSATDVVVTDTLPAWLTIVSATWASVIGNTYTRTIAQLPVGSSVTRSITVQAVQAGTINNSVQVSANTFDPILANNTSTFPVIVSGWTGTWLNNNGGNNNGGNNNGGNNNGGNNNGGNNNGGNNSNPGGSTSAWSSSASTGTGMHGAPVSSDGAKACMYDDAQYVAKWSFTDTIGHRWFPYIEMMRVSCIHKWPWGRKWLWIYEPNRSVTRAEVLKTLVKILGIQFANFEILHEDLPYRGDIVFTDTPNWFNHYAQYAYNQWLTDGLYTTDKKGNKYLSPDKAITRYEAIKVIMLAYAKLQQSAITTMGSSVLGDIIDTGNPYYRYVRQAETLWFISWVPQNDGRYNFEWLRNITRAEFAKIASLPFSEQLFDIAYIVENSSLYKKIITGLAETTMDKISFANIILQEINEIPEEEFLYSFKVSKDIFMDILAEKVLTPLLE